MVCFKMISQGQLLVSPETKNSNNEKKNEDDLCVSQLDGNFSKALLLGLRFTSVSWDKMI